MVTATVKGQDIEASSVALRLHGMQIAGNGGYDLGTQHLHAHIEGNNLQLSKFATVQKAGSPVDGVLNLVADANGTMAEPGLQATLRLANLTLNGAALGEVAADVHSEGKVVSYTANSTLVGAKLNLAGTTQLVGGYQTQAKLTLSGLDVAQPIAIFAPGSVKATSAISGVVTVSGPAANPQAMSGTAELDNVDVKLQGIELKAAEPVRVSLAKGVARLEQVHITGQDTDLRASGTVQVFGAVDAKGQPDATGGKIDLRSTGSLNVALAHTFNPDLISSGKVVFTVAAAGILKKPALTGNVDIQKVNFAIEGISNGLTDLNGRLVFNEDRLQVQNLTATTGGGQLKLGGFITYSGGLYANLTATGDKVRVRLNGLSATANVGLTLQGGPDDLRLGRECAADAVWNRSGCGFRGVRLDWRRGRAARSQCADESYPYGYPCHQFAAAKLSEQLCEAGWNGRPDSAGDSGGAFGAGAHTDYRWLSYVCGDHLSATTGRCVFLESCSDRPCGRSGRDGAGAELRCHDRSAWDGGEPQADVPV